MKKIKDPEKEPSAAKLAANRENAKKATGPRTAEGKANSARNALKHGLLSRNLLFRDGDGSRQEFAVFLENLRRDRQPVGPLEDSLWKK